jgi:peptidoglycan/LPS O-acetylase OafA/YrhL
MDKSRYVLLNIYWPIPAYPESRSIFDEGKSRTKDTNNSREWTRELFLDASLFMYGMSPVASVCLPSGCSQRDIESLIQDPSISSVISPIRVDVLSTVSREEEASEEEVVHSLLRILCRTLLLTLVITTIVSSVTPRQGNILRHFDAVNNTKKLFTESNKKDPLGIVHGFKALYLFSCIFAHFGTPLNKALLVYLFEIIKFVNQSPVIEAFSKIGFAVVSFNFVIGAALSVNSWMPVVKAKEGKVSLQTFILYRLLRTMPLSLASIAFILSFPLIPQDVGPMVKYIQANMTGNCLQNAWKELLLISNYDFVLESCNTVSWFSSADFQMYLVNFATLLVLYKKPKFGVGIIVAQFFLGIVFHYFSIVNNNASPVIIMFVGTDYTKLLHSFKTIWSQTHNNLTSYAVGMLLGVAFNFNVRIKSKRLSNTLWYVCIVLFYSSLAVPIIAYDSVDFKFSRSWEEVLGVLFKAVACLSFAGVMFLAWHDGQESRLYHFLSWKGWTPVSRISYSVFMTHPFVITFVWASSQNPFMVNYVEVFIRFIFLLLASFAFGLLAFVVVEAPFFNLVKEMMAKKPLEKVDSCHKETRKDLNENIEKTKAA